MSTSLLVVKILSRFVINISSISGTQYIGQLARTILGSLPACLPKADKGSFRSAMVSTPNKSALDIKVSLDRVGCESALNRRD